jgi:prepilin-type processing-associated H-X9-DG protein
MDGEGCGAFRAAMSTQHPEPLDYAAVKPRGLVRPWVIGLVTILSLGAAWFVYPGNRDSKFTGCSNLVNSACRLKSIGQGCQLYSFDNYHQMPPDLAALVLTQDMYPEDFVDRQTNTAIPSGLRESKDLRAQAAWVQAYGDYEYLGGGLDFRMVPADLVVAYERHLSPADAAEGRNTLFGDGHVKWLTKKKFDAQLDWTKSQLTAMRMGSLWLRVGLEAGRL